MKRKIEKVIDSCYDCNHMSVFSTTTSKAYICLHAHSDNEYHNHDSEPILLDVCSNGTNALPIPDNCPLEDYLPIKNPNHENKTIPNP